MIGRLLKPRSATTWSGQTSTEGNVATWLLDYGAGSASRAGPAVDESASLTLPAVFRALDSLASHLSMLPLPVFEQIGPDEKQRTTAHANHRLLNRQPNPEMTAFNFRRCLHLNTQLYGNGYAEIVREGTAGVRSLWPLHPSRVKCGRAEDGDKRLLYAVHVPGAPSRMLEARDICHMSALSGDGINGIGLIRGLAKENIGLALAIARYAESFFGNSTILGAVLTSKQPLGKKRVELEEQWNAARSGTDKAFGAVLLDGDLDIKTLRSDMEAAKTVELMTFSVQDIARWTNMPTPMLMELSRATFSNITELGLWYARYTLPPWFKVYEGEYNRKLFTTVEQATLYVEHVADGLLRGDSKSRAAFYHSMLGDGVYSINEVRRLENMNPIEGGDEHHVQLNRTTVKRMAMGDVGEEAGGEAPQGGMGATSVSGGDSGDALLATIRRGIAEAHAPLLTDTLMRMSVIEARAAHRARTKDAEAFYTWLPVYYDERGPKVRAAIIPCMDALGGAVKATLSRNDVVEGWEEFVAEQTEAVTAEYVIAARTAWVHSFDVYGQWAMQYLPEFATNAVGKFVLRAMEILATLPTTIVATEECETW